MKQLNIPSLLVLKWHFRIGIGGVSSAVKLSNWLSLKFSDMFFRIRHPFLSKCLLRMWKCRKSNPIQIFYEGQKFRRQCVNVIDTPWGHIYFTTKILYEHFGLSVQWPWDLNPWWKEVVPHKRVFLKTLRCCRFFYLHTCAIKHFISNVSANQTKNRIFFIYFFFYLLEFCTTEWNKERHCFPRIIMKISSNISLLTWMSWGWLWLL